MAITYEKIYGELMAFLASGAMETAVADVIRTAAIQNTRGTSVLSDVLIDVKEAIAEKNAKSVGRGSARTAALNIIKGTPRGQKGAWKEGENQCFSNGFIGVSLSRNHFDLPEVEPLVVNLTGLLNRQHHPEPLELPDLSDLKSRIAIKKAEVKSAKRCGEKVNVYYHFGEDKPMVNAEYLLWVMTILPNAKATYNISMETISNVYLESEDGRAIICPVRQKEDTVKNCI